MERNTKIDLRKYAWKHYIDYRKHPEKYRVGKGEQGVLICEPYKSEILPHWRFRTVAYAKESSRKIYRLFKQYLDKDDFVGADMARKFIQMGYTRARRYANYRGGRKYKNDKGDLKPRGTGDPDKAKSAAIFLEVLYKVNENEKYIKLKRKWKEIYG